MQGSLASWAAIAGAIATFIIALLTLFNVRVARNSLKLMEQREKRLQPALQLFHINSYLKRDKEQNSRIYAVNISITCASDTDNSVQDLSMRIYFKRNQATVSNVAIPIMKNINKAVTDLVGVNSQEIIVIPLKIRAHEAVTGWALFNISNEFLADSSIENYQVVLTDVYSKESFFEIKVMREVD